MTLPSALRPFGAFRNFVLYVIVPSKSRPGKTDKLPVDFNTGRFPVDAQDASYWSNYETIKAYADMFGAGYGVGFVFTEKTPFWFLDIDNCVYQGTWSPLAQEMFAELNGCAGEVSSSGKGCHLFGVGRIPKHRCNPTDKLIDLELYHTGRFVAFGDMTITWGDASFDCSDGLKRIVDKYFTPSDPSSDTPATWTDKPCVEWRGSVNDDELLRRAFEAKSAAGVFGAKATFQQLFDADQSALSQAYPDLYRDRGYDESLADGGLAMHLMFWTGKDCERTKRIMMRSKLIRDKWDREDYLNRTILNAMGASKTVCIDKTQVAAEGFKVGEFLGPSQLTEYFKDCVYVMSHHGIMVPGGEIMPPQRFDVMYGGHTFAMDNTSMKSSKSAFEAFTLNQAVSFPKASDTEFRPDLPTGFIRDGFVNNYRPKGITPVHGNANPFLTHMHRLFPNREDRDQVLCYLAAIIRHPGIKFRWTILIQGAQGNGKSLISDCMAAAIGKEHWYCPRANQITGQFNAWMDNKILITVEDVYVPEQRGDLLEALKPMITQEYLEVEAKGVDRKVKRVCCNYILNSNHRDAIKKTRNDRRFAVYYTPQQSYEDIVACGMDADYFGGMYRWLAGGGYAIVADYLKYRHELPDELNPAIGCQRAPVTTSFEDSVYESASRLEEEIRHMVDGDEVGFRGGWVSSTYLDKLVDDRRLAGQYRRSARHQTLIDMGYIKHPSLVEGQTTNTIMPDGRKPVLYVLKGHESIGRLPGQICAMYSEAQFAQGPALKVVQS